ncbi:39S ribosomal protein L42, mitochondrial [Sceloporus undulatus]|uniref:39S ribosomal protein L42, mitochondrial n=1 Tax=Sceloporus undulatus TaxID=8520 RepID=UPI001C4C93B7|nr:39S ribosomal protein L42, mitochondrial [Sceloporus undulatus]
MAIASRRAVLSSTMWTRLAAFTRQDLVPGSVNCSCPKSTYSALPDDYNCKVELALTSDGKTIVCYHPSVDIPYEHTRPVPRRDPLDYKDETHDQVLKSRLEEEKLKNQKGPTIEQLSKMFYTTKHRWYPVGQYHTRRKKTNTPKDR